MKTIFLFIALLITVTGFGQSDETVSLDGYIITVVKKYLNTTVDQLKAMDEWIIDSDYSLVSNAKDTTSIQEGWLVYLSGHGKVTVGKNAKLILLKQSPDSDLNVSHIYTEYQTKRGKIIPNNSVILFKPNN